MIEYHFVEKPDPELAGQVMTLYRLAGWWPEVDEGNLGLVARMIEGSHHFLVARDGKITVGVCRAIGDRASDAYIQDFTVHPDYRHRGIGTCLLKTLLERLRNDGLSWIGLIAEGGTTPFYLARGFKQMKNSTPMILGK